MTTSLSSGNTTVSGSVTTTIGQLNIPIPTGTGQTLVVVSGTGTGSVATWYTVTAGKTFYLFGALAVTSSSTTIYASDGTTVRLYVPAAIGTVSGTCPIASYASTTVVKGLASNTYAYSFWGVEV